MGNVIDLERVDLNPRCSKVKEIIVYISLIAPPLSFLVLIFGIFRMLFVKKKKTFLTKIIILIFVSEIFNIISKMIQIIKYHYPDQRMDKKIPDLETPRGNICQIQIVLAMFSDYCSLLLSLLISLRCYDIIKNKKRFFVKAKANLSIFFVIFISIIFSMVFLYVDKKVSKGNISYRYDVRDRCSYWCWLDHYVSLTCFGFYWIIIFVNIFFACKIRIFLKRGYEKILAESEPVTEMSQNSDNNAPLENISKDNIDDNQKNESKLSDNKYNSLSNEDLKRIEELRIMKIKCTIYPTVTIILWLIIGVYRTVDDSFMIEYDNAKNATKGREAEQADIENNPSFKYTVQTFLVLHTLLASLRGIFYGLSFIVFEEKFFGNIFSKCLKKKFVETNFDNSEESNKLLDRITRNSSNNKTQDEKDEDEDKIDNLEMNSDNNYNESEKNSNY